MWPIQNRMKDQDRLFRTRQGTANSKKGVKGCNISTSANTNPRQPILNLQQLCKARQLSRIDSVKKEVSKATEAPLFTETDVCKLIGPRVPGHHAVVLAALGPDEP